MKKRSRDKSWEVLSGYVQDQNLFEDHAGSGLLGPWDRARVEDSPRPSTAKAVEYHSEPKFSAQVLDPTLKQLLTVLTALTAIPLIRLVSADSQTPRAQRSHPAPRLPRA